MRRSDGRAEGQEEGGGAEVVTVRTGVTLQPRTTWPGEGTPGPGRLDSSPD